ncbi:MAG: ABC transporter permease [Turicibacter sp.]|nr:ABC transporter permease [Turicibacter sp.]
MKSYLIMRLLRSFISLTLVMSIVFSLIYTAIPKDRVFYTDTNIEKLQKRPDDLTNYKHLQWARLGFTEYKTLAEFCRESGALDLSACNDSGSDDARLFFEKYLSLGFTVEAFPQSGTLFAYREIPNYRRILNFWGNLFQVENVFAKGSGLHFGRDFNGNLALIGRGTRHKYLIYANGAFPFIHQNLVRISLGQSYPTYRGQDVVQVISGRQGRKVVQQARLGNGEVVETALDLHSCRYNENPSLQLLGMFPDGFSDCSPMRRGPSMLAISFILGFGSLVLSYGIGLPLGVLMASHQGKWIDRLGQAYIIVMMSVPSLAYVVLIRYLGGRYGGLPTMFALYGSQDIRSFMLPTLSLAIGSVAGRMMWMRRYMVDQSSQDYVRFARATGLGEGRIFSRHIFRNAIGPIAHGLPAAVIFTLSGALITESVYGIPGMGKLLPDSIAVYNNTMVIGITFFFTVLSILSTLLGDMLLAILDPRIALYDKHKAGKRRKKP